MNRKHSLHACSFAQQHADAKLMISFNEVSFQVNYHTEYVMLYAQTAAIIAYM